MLTESVYHSVKQVQNTLFQSHLQSLMKAPFQGNKNTFNMCLIILKITVRLIAGY